MLKPNEHCFFIIILKGLQAMQGWERAINTLSVRRPQPHNTTVVDYMISLSL